MTGNKSFVTQIIGFFFYSQNDCQQFISQYNKMKKYKLTEPLCDTFINFFNHIWLNFVGLYRNSYNVLYFDISFFSFNNIRFSFFNIFNVTLMIMLLIVFFMLFLIYLYYNKKNNNSNEQKENGDNNNINNVSNENFNNNEDIDNMAQMMIELYKKRAN